MAEFADERGTTGSGFLREVARRDPGRPDPAELDAAITRGRSALAEAGAFESAELIRRERRGRDAGDRRRH
jgi:hypothetical protein